MPRFLIPVILLISACLACGETSIEGALKKYNKGSVPYIDSSELSKTDQFLILDTREKEEYDVSHIEGAIWVGYETFRLDRVDTLLADKATSLVVYCSVGVRSEDIGEKLIKAGFPEVKNLYGGIFQWKNEGLPVVDSTGRYTDNVHAYSKYWGNLLTEANKVY